MLRRSQDGYYLVSDKDLVVSLQYAHHHQDTLMIKKLNEVFVKMEDIVTIGKTSYHKTNDFELIDYLLIQVKISNRETYIDHNILKEGYIISKCEKNHEMNKKIFGYFTQYLNNEINGLSNDVLTAEIINDKKVLKYLRKYENLDDFITRKINKKVSLLEMDNQEENVKKKKIA